jgi:hypothetical protein
MQGHLRTSKAVVMVVETSTTCTILHLTFFLYLKFPFELKELSLKPRIGKDNASLLLAKLQSLKHSHVVFLHQISHNACCAP